MTKPYNEFKVGQLVRLKPNIRIRGIPQGAIGRCLSIDSKSRLNTLCKVVFNGIGVLDLQAYVLERYIHPITLLDHTPCGVNYKTLIAGIKLGHLPPLEL